MTDRTDTLTPRQTPEERELEDKRAKLLTLETDVAQRELDLATLQRELRAFEGRYFRIVGVLYRELDELEAQIAEAQARRNAQDPELRARAATARAKATDTANATSVVLRRSKDAESAPSERLKKLYREAARRIHPDLATDDKERARRNRVMADANRAYEEGDEAKLCAILEEWHTSPEAVEGEGIGAELIRTIRKIHQVERRLTDIAVAIAKLKASELYELKQKVDTAQADGQDLLAQMAAQLKTQIAQARTRLDALIAGMRA